MNYTHTGFVPMVATNGYSTVQQQAPRDDQSQMSHMLEEAKLVKSESMDITNDPRFFTGNVIDKRLAAFAGLSVVSGLMVQNAMDTAFGMKKNMNFTTYDGLFQFVGFTMVCVVLFCNMLAVYVGVAQPYHTYRLMTAGPTGFESAAAYYLHKDVVAWRHLSVKLMLLSLPVFLMSSGFRFIVKFDRDLVEEKDLPTKPPLYARIEGIVCCLLFILVGLALAHIHWRHEEIFKRIYDSMYTSSAVSSIVTQVQQMMTPGRVRSRMGQ